MSDGAAARSRIDDYFSILAGLLARTEADFSGTRVPLQQGFDWVRTAARGAHARGNKIMFIGNGGSASIASHLAIDFSKNGGLRAMAFNDAAALTCLGNDLGYENVFAQQLEMHAREGDLLIAISSSGRSANILNGVRCVRRAGCAIATFSGFTPENELRALGDVNFFLASRLYGFVEVGHLALCHAILDMEMGWQPTTGDVG